MKYLDDILIMVGCGFILVGTYVILPVATLFVAGAMLITAGVLIGIGARGIGR